MDKSKLFIAIPASIISDTPHLREKTSKIGLIARAAAIFRVNKIIVYPDSTRENQLRDLKFIAKILNYIETPQYLRKNLFKIESDLQYAGILPPLRAPHHPTSGKNRDLKVGEYREGIILNQTKEGLIVDIGVQSTALLRERQFSVGERLTVQVIKNDNNRVEIQAVNRDDVSTYWGFQVIVEDQTFGHMLQTQLFDLVISTARIADNFVDVSDKIAKRWSKAEKVLIAFGAPSRGLHEIVKEEGLSLEAVSDFIVNTVPKQGTATVRTEEALLISLALFNAYFNL
ncbi:MAG: RNA methyltransferase [Candidatus Bathyarchaeota archaeon]|uniref:RNA methyltransferase n=1 Tax=Candidatus Bathycorpusculum sp. TaxID=2994959 RepID=UPI00281DB09E|nr:RNA methyltransferase [Candidatus Termiticorpusculum sp.]MCL2257058.1 RNA methyltransferase [Candidatus Termiticorpusculum sp.]MCL2292816.1 RNA methyltransferase [Candidatus Termiticorpusculum sp.]